MNDELRVAVVGLGRVSGGHIEGWKACDKAQIAAICDVDERKIAAAQRQHELADVRTSTNYTELLAAEDIDAVDFCLPDYLHREAALGAAEAGKHILCEKPLGMTAEQAEEMLAAAEAAGIVHQVRFQRRYSRLVNHVKQLVEDGALGELRHFRCRLSVHRISDPNVNLEWRLQADEGSYGVLGDLGAHAIDMAHFVMGAAAGEVIEAVAMPAIFIPAREYEDGKGTGEVTGFDAISFSLRYERNVLASYQMSRFSPGTDQWEIDGQEASIKVGGSSASKYLWFERAPKDDQVPASQFVEREIPADFPQFGSEFDAFCEAIIEGKPAMPDFNDGLRVARVLDMVAQACK